MGQHDYSNIAAGNIMARISCNIHSPSIACIYKNIPELWQMRNTDFSRLYLAWQLLRNCRLVSPQLHQPSGDGKIAFIPLPYEKPSNKLYSVLLPFPCLSTVAVHFALCVTCCPEGIHNLSQDVLSCHKVFYPFLYFSSLYSCTSFLLPHLYHFKSLLLPPS